MSKTYTELVEEIDNLYEKGMSQSEVAELIDDAISVATKVKNDPKKSDKDKRTASSVIKKIRGIKKTFQRDGSIHPNAVDACMRVVTGVHSGRYGYMKPNNPKVPKNYRKEETELNEGMTDTIAKGSAILLKKRSIGFGNKVQSTTDIGDKIDYLSQQLNAVAGIALLAVSISGEGLLSKGAIFTSLFSSYDPDAYENLDALFEDVYGDGVSSNLRN